MELGIKGHKTRGDEVIKILEMLGGNNMYNIKGVLDNYFYYIGDEDIRSSYIGPEEIKGYEIFSLEDFLEKFPYKVGDKVTLDNKLCSIIRMVWECNNIYYFVQGTDTMFTKKIIANELKPIIEEKSFQGGYEKCKSEMNMNDNNVDLTLKISTCYVLSDGYHFADENGNVIDAKKILLVKNAPTYPKTYKECCDVLGIDTMDNDAKGYKHFLLIQFQELIIARDAYWKIAGEELGLDKPWKPVWDESEDLYTIHTFNGEIRLSGTAHRNAILVFPTEEIRDTFDVNFENLIEKCKELL